MEEKTEQEKVRKLGYKTEKFVISKENINKFKIMEDRRAISPAHVKQIHGSLLDGKNPIGVLIVNKIGEDMRLIDGNHRIEAIRRYFEYKPVYGQVKIECTLKVYENLTPTQEREVYTLEAKRKNESHEDRLNLFKDTITFWDLITDKFNEFPTEVTIYGAKKGLKFRSILNAICTMKVSEEKYNPQVLGKEEIVEFAQSLGWDDFNDIKGFIEFFVEIFGEIDADNMFARYPLFASMYDIYIKNKEFKSDKTFNERFERLLAKSELINLAQMHRREAHLQIREVMLKHLNKGYSTKVFR